MLSLEETFTVPVLYWVSSSLNFSFIKLCPFPHVFYKILRCFKWVLQTPSSSFMIKNLNLNLILFNIILIPYPVFQTTSKLHFSNHNFHDFESVLIGRSKFVKSIDKFMFSIKKQCELGSFRISLKTNNR